jgi:hypothetical protein
MARRIDVAAELLESFALDSRSFDVGRFDKPNARAGIVRWTSSRAGKNAGARDPSAHAAAY